MDGYDAKLAEEVLERLADGEGLEAIARIMGFRPATFRGWIIDDVEGLAARYARARDIGLDRMAEELIEIADTPVEGIIEKHGKDGVEITKKDALEHRRLRVDTRKWYLSKLAPKRYGDRVALTSESGGPLTVQIVKPGD